MHGHAHRSSRTPHDMGTNDLTRRLEQNLRWYAVYVAASNALFWMPVFFLYFALHLDVSQVLVLEAVYYAAVVVLEVPTGVISDRWGRRRVLALSGAAMAGGAALIAAGHGLVGLAMGQVLLALGRAATSGSDTALHLDTLQALGRDDEYGAREARLARIGLGAAALAALAGGALGTWSLAAAYVASAVMGAASLVAALALVEPPETVAAVPTQRGAVRAAAALARGAELRWLFAVAVSATVLNHLPYELYQPYLERVLPSWSATSGTVAAPVAGLHMMAAMALGAWVAGYSDRMRRAIGVGPLLLLSLVIQAALVGLVAVWTHPLVALALVLRGVPRGLQDAPLNAEVAPRVPRSLRATYLSLQSLAGRLAFSGTLLLLALASSGASDALAATARAGAVFGAVVIALLVPGAITSRRSGDAP